LLSSCKNYSKFCYFFHEKTHAQHKAALAMRDGLFFSVQKIQKAAEILKRRFEKMMTGTQDSCVDRVQKSE
jgi:hypothetical protein